MRRFLWIAVVFLCSSGCSVHYAMQQPDRVNLDIVRAGTPRHHLIAEFGSPIHSEPRLDGQPGTVDIFVFKQGYTRWEKAGRALAHGVADVATMGVWEVVGVPLETIANGEPVKLLVAYKANGQVERFDVLEGGELFKVKESVSDQAD